MCASLVVRKMSPRFGVVTTAPLFGKFNEAAVAEEAPKVCVKPAAKVLAWLSYTRLLCAVAVPPNCPKPTCAQMAFPKTSMPVAYCPAGHGFGRLANCVAAAAKL